MKNFARFFAVVIVVCFAAPAFATVVIDFGTGNAGVGGTFTLLPGGNASGVNIPIQNLTVNGTLGFDGVYAVSGACGGVGCLNFNTQANIITITGGVVAPLSITGQTLLSGSFTGWTANANGLLNAVGPDTKSPALLTALGISSPPYNFNYFGFSITTNGAPGSVISTDIRNTGSNVPEPASLSLISLGLLGLGLIGNKLRRS